MPIETLFVTRLYRARIAGAAGRRLHADVARACAAIAAEDVAGQRWARAHGYPGYTSYASLNDLAWRDPTFASLVTALDRHVLAFARKLHLDLAGRRLVCDSLWINRLDPGGQHTAHIHPGSVISGTYYVALPKGARGLKLEDPRLGLMMASPVRRTSAPRADQSFVEIAPEPGMVLLWESWLRHEVPPSHAKAPRVSVSFNYRLG